MINTFYISIFNLVDTTILLIKKEFFIVYLILEMENLQNKVEDMILF